MRAPRVRVGARPRRRGRCRQDGGPGDAVAGRLVQGDLVRGAAGRPGAGRVDEVPPCARRLAGRPSAVTSDAKSPLQSPRPGWLARSTARVRPGTESVDREWSWRPGFGGWAVRAARTCAAAWTVVPCAGAAWAEADVTTPPRTATAAADARSAAVESFMVVFPSVRASRSLAPDRWDGRDRASQHRDGRISRLWSTSPDRRRGAEGVVTGSSQSAARDRRSLGSQQYVRPRSTMVLRDERVVDTRGRAPSSADPVHDDRRLAAVGFARRSESRRDEFPRLVVVAPHDRHVRLEVHPAPRPAGRRTRRGVPRDGATLPGAEGRRAPVPLRRAARPQRPPRATLRAFRSWQVRHGRPLVRFEFGPGAAGNAERALAETRCEWHADRTITVDLVGATPESLTAGMKSNARYHLRSGVRRGVEVRPAFPGEITTLLPELLEEAYRSRGVPSPYPADLGARWSAGRRAATTSTRPTR